jgi:hypothetical protein
MTIIDGGNAFSDFSDSDDPGYVTAALLCSDIASDVRAKFGDSGDVQINDTLILSWINNGARRISAVAPFTRRVGKTNILASVASYDMKKLFPDAAPVTYETILANGDPVKILPWPEFLQIINGGDYQDTVGDGVRVAAEYGGDLVLWPTPVSTVADGLVVYYTSLPDRVTSMSDPVPVPDRLYNALNDYVFQQTLELDENFQDAEIKRQHAEAQIREQMEQQSSSPTDYYPQMTEDPADYI